MAASLMATSLAASAVGDAEEGSVAAANGSTATAAVATGSSTGSTTAVSDATTGSVDACTSVSSDRPGGCLEFELEALKKPKELREPYSSCPDILLFA
jgi:hypothetical protein